MSYCRFGNADAYIFEHVGGYWQCCGCSLARSGTIDEWNFPTRRAMLAHIAKHREAGDYIPSDVDERLQQEIDSENKNTS